MATGFDTVTFGITTDGTLPSPTRDDSTGLFHYTATIKVNSRADMLALQNMMSIITELPAIGALDIGTIVIEKGVGVRTLTYPEGTFEYEVDAILTSFSPLARSHVNGPYIIECQWMIPEVPD